MIKLLLLTLVGFIVYSMIQGRIRPPQDQNRTPRNRSRDGEQMVEDPQCGTFLPISDAVKAQVNGKELYFCSKKCLRTYKKTH